MTSLFVLVIFVLAILPVILARFLVCSRSPIQQPTVCFLDRFCFCGDRKGMYVKKMIWYRVPCLKDLKNP